MGIQTPKSLLKLKGIDWFILVILYLCLLAFHGYRFGDEDMTETLSYALYLNDPTLYPNDPYIQAVGPTTLNERFPFAFLLSLVGDHLEWACYLLHLLTTFLLLVGIWQLGALYLRNYLTRLILVGLTLFITYHLNLGANEIWYNYFVPSHLAKSIAIWGLVFWLSDRVYLGYLLVALATFAHPVVGAQLALLFALVDLPKMRYQPKSFVVGPIGYALTAGIWIALIFTSHLIKDQSITDSEFYDIMETRLGHHFFPSYYPVRAWIILIPLFLIAMRIWNRKDRKLTSFFLWSIAGMIIYVTGVEWLEIPSLLSVQWFKITVWLKPLSILAMLTLLDASFDNISLKMTYGLVISLAILALLTLGEVLNFRADRPMHLPGTDYHTLEMQMGKQIRDQLPRDACIIIPPDVTGIRYFSQRSVYIDYKSNIHSKIYLAEAAKRRKELYGLSLDIRQSTKDMMHQLNLYYGNLNENDFLAYEKQGVEYVLVKSNQKLSFSVIATNSLFTLYKF